MSRKDGSETAANCDAGISGLVIKKKESRRRVGGDLRVKPGQRTKVPKETEGEKEDRGG